MPALDTGAATRWLGRRPRRGTRRAATWSSRFPLDRPAPRRQREGHSSSPTHQRSVDLNDGTDLTGWAAAPHPVSRAAVLSRRAAAPADVATEEEAVLLQQVRQLERGRLRRRWSDDADALGTTAEESGATVTTCRSAPRRPAAR